VNLETLRLQIKPMLIGTEFCGKVYFAGGCVRDWELEVEKSGGREVEGFGVFAADVDISVDLPNGGIRLAEYLCPKLEGEDYCSYPAYGTAKFSAGGTTLEFVATRKEVYKLGNRYPKVFPGTLADDVLRRDFTINALLMNAKTGEILDLCSMGLSDLQQGTIRCVGEPFHKFNEDPLRLLRALRFALRFGFRIEPGTYNAMKSEDGLISQLSARSIEAELQKMLQYCAPQTVQQEIYKLGWKLSV
jgi:poly(A) polymerase